MYLIAAELTGTASSFLASLQSESACSTLWHPPYYWTDILIVVS